MNDIYFCTYVLAHSGLRISAGGGICFLIVLVLFMFGLLIFRKNTNIKRLFISSIIPYVLVAITMMDFFDLYVPYIVRKFCTTVVWYSGLIFANTGSLACFLVAAFIVDTLIIFGIIRLILFIKHEISGKKSQTEETV